MSGAERSDMSGIGSAAFLKGFTPETRFSALNSPRYLGDTPVAMSRICWSSNAASSDMFVP